MMRTCKLCGLKYQTMAEDGPKYCHKCTLLTFQGILKTIKPILFEYSIEQLSAFTNACKSVSTFINTEVDRRSRYYANMLAQRKIR